MADVSNEVSNINNASPTAPESQSLFEYDMLQMYMNTSDYHVTDKIAIHQPTIGEITQYGEKDFFRMTAALCANPTSLRLELWDLGIDWNKITEFQLFTMVAPQWEQKQTEILFGDLDFQKFKLTTKENSDDLVMVYLPDISIQIDELVYLQIVDYLRFMFNIHPKVERAKGKTTKEFIIEGDRMDKAAQERLERMHPEKRDSGVLFRLISSAVNHPGFKYKKNELIDVGIVEFLDSVNRLRLYEQCTSVMKGIYSGFVDTKGMNIQKETDWTQDMYSGD